MRGRGATVSEQQQKLQEDCAQFVATKLVQLLHDGYVHQSKLSPYLVQEGIDLNAVFRGCFVLFYVFV